MTMDKSRLRDPFDGPWPWENDSMGPDVHVSDIAQRALGDAFDQLIRIGSAGSSQCHRYSQVPYEPAERMDPQTAARLLTSAREALRYAEAQLQYLTIPAPPRKTCCADEDADEAEAEDTPSDAPIGAWGGHALAAGGA